MTQEIFNPIEFVKGQEVLFCESLADTQITWKQECQFAIQAFQKNTYLATVAKNNPASAQNAIINVAAIGITLNPANQYAYLVPRDKQVCLDISYKGLLHLAQQSGSIAWGQTKIVYELDEYETNGVDKAPTHRYKPFGDRGAPVGAYCTVKTADGDYLTEEMSADQILAIRDRSQSYKSGKPCPWRTDELEMWRKTVVKRGSKYWPKVERLSKAIDYLNTDGGEGITTISEEPEKEVVINPVEYIQTLLPKLERTEAQFFEWASKMLKTEVDSFDGLTADQLQSFIRKLENTL
ncbi:recombinase RecT [Endozoicomonas arenosclerae]|uniref:recombinase RecT n=1 Tax=Endozoicomonas arenosclerae TaxID=1633495 RepID=UPI0007843C7D|nr:RecT family recombinase [Endozoicomonas arenosclerae]